MKKEEAESIRNALVEVLLEQYIDEREEYEKWIKENGLDGRVDPFRFTGEMLVIVV